MCTFPLFRSIAGKLSALIATLVAGAALAAGSAPQNCVEWAHPKSLSQLTDDAQLGTSQDIGNLTVIELGGNYDRGLQAPRQLVAARFLAAHPDTYDFLFVFTTFEFQTGSAVAFYNSIRNDTAGIGLPVFDFGADYGSATRLQGYIDMAAMSRYSFVPDSPNYQQTLDTLAHEMMHRWTVYTHFINADGADSADLLGLDGVHWSYFLDTDASVMYGNDWQLQADGKFHSVDVRHRYSSLDLYLAGFAAPSEVSPFTLIRNGSGGVATDLPALGATSGGQGETISIDQIIAASDARVPAAANAQKDFTGAMILLKRPGESVSPDQLLELERLRVRFEQQFVQMTDGRGLVRVYTQQRDAAITGPPQILQGSGSAATPAGVVGAVAWIEARQAADGHWEDRPATAVRDTVAVVRALTELDPAFAGLASARAWIAAHAVANNDQLAWKLLGANLPVDATALANMQDAQGGFAINRGWTAGAYDTALVASALASHDSNTQALSAALQFVGTQQNADGSFGAANFGHGQVLSTLRSASAFTGSSDHVSIRQHAADWILTQQRSDGGIGDGRDDTLGASLSNTVETYSLLGKLPLSASAIDGTRLFVRQSQQIGGDWGGSVYLTATAALATAHDQSGNLALASAPTVAPVQPHDGELATLSAVVANTGNVPVAASVARWYDGDPDHGGVQIGPDTLVPALVANSTASVTQSWDTTGRAGDHVVWLLLDANAAIAESSEQDNRGSVSVTVLAPSILPDLAVNTADFYLQPSAVSALPSAVHLTGMVRNIGSTGVSGVVVRLYAKSDLTTALAQATLDVPARGSAPLAMDFTVSAPTTLNLLVRVDPDNVIAEANETNNDASLLLPFGQSLDLEITPADLGLVEATQLVGRNIDFNVTLHNRGTVDSPPATVRAQVTQGGVSSVIFDEAVQVSAGQSITRQLAWRTNQPGAAQLQVAVDPDNQIVETREDNNAAQLDFTVAALDQPDLTYLSDSLNFNPSPALQGQPMTATLGARNLSSVATASFNIALYAADPRSGALPLASTTIASMAGSSDTIATIVVPDLGLVGDQTLYAKIDSDNQIAELDETNNIIIKPLRVFALPDLAVSVADIALTPALPVQGQPVQARVTVRNLGGQDAHGVVVRLLEGDAATGSAAGADQSIATLAAGASAVLTWNWTLGLVPNSRSVTAIADPDNSVREGSEDNNSATLPFDVQNSDFFTSERYISPNGDGIQDAAAIVFRMPQAGPAEVDVVNGAKYTVRHFSNVQLNDDLRGQVIWDGRDDRGRIVPDGDYRVVATGADLQNHGGVLITVDNNLSSVLEAVDTPYGVYGDLPAMYSVQIPPASSPLHDQLFGLNGGLIRSPTLFPDNIPIISADWIERFRRAQQVPGMTLDQFAFSPDGRSVVARLTSRVGQINRTWIVHSAVDQTDSPVTLATFSDFASPPVLGFFDANTVVAGPTVDGMVQVIDVSAATATPLRSIADVQFYQKLKVLPSGILVSGDEYFGEDPQVLFPRDSSRGVVAFHSMSHDNNDPTYEYHSMLSPQASTIAVYERDAHNEKIDLIDLSSGTRTTLLQAVPGQAYGSRSDRQANVGRYAVAWLERQDQLLVQDAVNRTLIMFSESGQRVGEMAFAPMQRVGDYTVDSLQGLERADPSNVFAAVPENLLIGNCDWLNGRMDLGIEHQIFDPTTNRFFLRFGESIAHDVFLTGDNIWVLQFDRGIADYFSANPDTAAVNAVQRITLTPLISSADVTQHPLYQPCNGTPPADWPALTLSDGAHIRTDGHVQTLSHGVLPKEWKDRYYISAIWPDETRILEGTNTTFSSLLNLTAELQARTLGRGIELTGVAADRNFAYYKLDWASIEQPNDWYVLTPASSDQVFLDEFLTWVPPLPGTFVIRLTVVDKAGNSATTTASASSFDHSLIDSFSLAPRYFSPNGDGIQDQLSIKYRVLAPTTVALVISDANGKPVRSVQLTYGTTDLGLHTFEWDGRDDNGQVAPDGRYRIDLEGLGGWTIIDTVAPELSGRLVQAYERPENCPATAQVCTAPISVKPGLQCDVHDLNLSSLVLETMLTGTSAWAPLFEVASASLDLPVEIFANHSFRLRATDLAGNVRLLSLGEAQEVLPLVSVFQPGYLNRIENERLFYYQAPPLSQTPVVDSYPPIPFAVVEHDADDRLLAYDVSTLLSSIAVETAPIEAPEQWTERGNYALADVVCKPKACDAEASPSELRLPLNIDALPVGARAFVRLRGQRTDGTRLYSNQGYIYVGGIDPPLCAGPDRIAKYEDFSAHEYYDGPLAAATLHYLSPLGVEVTLDAFAIQGDEVDFRVPRVEVLGQDAWVTGIDSQGGEHKSGTAPLVNCGGSVSVPEYWSVVLAAQPVVQDQCDGRPSDRIALDFAIHGPSLDAGAGDAVALPSHVQLSYLDGYSSERKVLLDTDVDESNASQIGKTFTLSTAQWPEGEYETRLDLTYPGAVQHKVVQLPVVKQAPQIAIATPAEGSRVCAVRDIVSGQLLPITGSIDSPGASGYRIEIGAGAKPISFVCKTTAGEFPGSCSPYNELTNIDGSSINGSLGTIAGLLQQYNGISTVRMKGLNWSGGTVCTTSTIYLDSDIEYFERAPSTSGVLFVQGVDVGITPVGDAKFARGQFFLHANEPVQFRADVHPAHIDDYGRFALDDQVINVLSRSDSIQGDIDLSWDGRIDATLVPDGLYGIAASASDGCSNAKTIQYSVLVDATPPTVSLTVPLPGASVSAAVVEISGTASDLRLVGWSLDFAVPASPNTWQNLAVGTSPVPTSALLAAWSRGSLTGPVDLRLSAIDAFGNHSETHLPITLLAPAKLIGAAELQPPLFSPNGDGALDTTRLQLGLLQNANLDIRVNNAALYTGPASQGSSAFVWDGKDAGGHALADGIYPVVINAQDPNGIATPESVTLSATIDNTPPTVDIQQPTGAFASADSAVHMHVDDLHFASYQASLTRSVDGVVVASASGTQGGDVLLTALKGFDEGGYSLHVVARDGAGNVATRDASFQLDATPPAVTLTNPADAALIASAMPTSVKGSVNDAHLASYTLSVAPENVETWTDLAHGNANADAGEILSWTPNLPDGKYRLRLRAIDLAGNVTDVVHAITVDGMPPVAHISSPANGAFVRSAIDVEGSATDAHFAGYRLSVIQTSKLASGIWADVYAGTAPVDSAQLAALTLNLAEDDYVLRLVVTDQAGLSSTDQVSVHIDTEPPSAPIGLIGHVDNNRDAVLDWSAVTAMDLAGYFVYRGGQRITASPTAAIHYVDQNAPEGRMQYNVTAVDRAGNESVASNTVILLVDHTPPAVSIARPLANARIRGVYDIVGTAYSHDDFKQYRLSVQPLNPAGASTMLVSATLPVQGQKLASWNTLAIADETAVRIHLEGEDTQGNIATADIDVVVDNGPPAAPTGLTAVLTGVDVQTHWNPNSESDLLGYLLYRDSQLVNATGIFLPADLRAFALTDTQYLDKIVPDGQHSYVVYAIDRAGNVSPPSAPATLDPIDNKPPSMTIEAPADGAKFETNVTVFATSRDSDIAEVRFAYRAQGATDWIEFGGVFTDLPYRTIFVPPPGTPHGAFQIRAVARDLGGRTDPAPPVVNVIYADLTPPDAPRTPLARADADTVHVTWTASTATDVAGYRVYRNGGLVKAAGPPLAATSFDDPSLSDGDYTYTVTAVDSSGNESDPSTSSIAHVFGVTLDQPYSPTSMAAFDLSGSSARAGNIALRVDTDQASADSTPGATSNAGAIAVAAQALAIGGNHCSVRVTDADGNRSRVAEIWIDRGAIPAMPTGVTAVVADHAVNAGWNANSETDLLGYRVFRNGHPITVDAPTGDLANATDNIGGNPAAAVDGDPQTYWDASGVYSSPDAPPSDTAIELDFMQPHIVTVANLTWASAGTATGNVDMYSWSGHTWIRVAQARGDAHATQSITLTQPYRTTRIKLVVHGAVVSNDYQTLRLAELQLLERPTQTASTLAETLIDGTYRYQVSALSNFAFESPLSTEAIAAVGDTQGPDAVTLSGELAGNNATLAWTASTAPDVAHYDLLRDGTVVGSVSALDALRYVDQNLKLGAHDYVVYAYDGFNNASAPSNTLTLNVTGSAPAIPVNVTVTAPAEGGALDVSWTPGTGAAATSYILRRALASAGPYADISTQSATTRHDAPLTNGITYYYTVVAMDAAGNPSAPSTPANGTPHDRIAPVAPLLTYPTIAQFPLTMRATASPVCGHTEPGASVELGLDGIVLPSLLAASDYSADAPTFSGSIDRLLAAPDGDHVAVVLGNETIQVTGSGASGDFFSSDRNSRLQQWAAHGLTLYYADAAGDDVYRWELGQSAEKQTQPITLVSAFAVNATETMFAIAGSYAADAGAPVSSVWLVPRSTGTPRRIATIDPSMLNADTPLLWSPDGGHLLIVDSDSTLRLVDVASAAVVATLASDSNVQPSWNRNGTRFAFARANNQGGDDLLTFDALAQTTATLLQHATLLAAVAWSPADDGIAVLDADKLDIVSVLDGTSLLPLPYGNLNGSYRLTWTLAGRIFADNGSSAQRIGVPGWFCTAPITLAVGANHVSANATDASGNRSVASAAIEIDTPAAGLPDLAVAAADIFFLPPSGLVGQNYSALVTLHNLGATGVDAPQLAATLTAPDGSQRSLALQGPLSALAAGGSDFATFPLGLLTDAGTYRLDVAADPFQQLREANESNNAASAILALSATGKPVLELNLLRSLFAPGDAVAGDVAVTNPGSAFSGHVHLSVTDTGGAQVANLGDLPIAALGFGQRFSAPVTWDAQGVFAGDYRIRAQLFDAGGNVIDDRTAAFTIATVRHIQLALAPDAASAPLGHAVALHSTVDFSDGNAPLAGATLRLVALAPDHTEIWRSEHALGTLLPGYALARDDTWPATAAVEGTYTLRLSILSADTNASVDASVTLVAATLTATLSGNLVFDPGTTLIAGQNVIVHYRVADPGASSFAGVQTRLRIVTGNGQTPVSETDDQFDLAPYATHDSSLTLTAPPLALINYAAILEARLPDDGPGQWRLLAQQGFSVVDQLPPVITILNPLADVVQPAVVPLRASIVDQHSAVTGAEVSVDGGNWQPISAGIDGTYARGLTGLIDGAHALSVRAHDSWGNQAQTVPLAFMVDATPPLIAITGVSDGDAVNHAVTALISVADAHLASSDIRLNGSVYVSGTVIDQDGSYVLSVRATDVAGNLSIASARFVIDRSPPPIAILAPADGALVGQSAIHVDVQTETLANVTIGTGSYHASAVADAQGHADFDAVPLVVGANPIQASATDRAGNLGGPVTVSVTYQPVVIAPLTGTLQPDTTDLAYGVVLGVGVHAQNPNAAALTAQQLRVRVLDPAQTVLATQLITHDFAALETYTTNLDFASDGWPLGALTLTLELNQSGTWIALDTKQINLVDRTPPLLALTMPLEGDVVHGPIVLHATASDALTGVATVEARFDSGDWNILSADGVGVYASLATALADADHVVELRSHDGAGNLATIGPVHFAIDSVSPLINVAGVADGDLLAHAVSPTIGIADVHLLSSDVRLNGQPYFSGTAITTSGDYRIDIAAADAAGNHSSATVHFTLDLDAPTILFTSPAANAVVTTSAVDVSGQTEALAQVHLSTGTFSVDIAADSAGLFTVPGVPLQPGANTLLAHATDRAGNVGADAGLVVTWQTTALGGSIGPLAARIALGQPLDAPYTLHNTGNVNLAALSVRIELRAAGDATAAQTDGFSVDLPAGADFAGTRQITTAALVPGDYTAVLLANLPLTPGPGGWTVLDSASTQVFVTACNGRGSDVIFADGFDPRSADSRDSIFCNGFENAVQIVSTPVFDPWRWKSIFPPIAGTLVALSREPPSTSGVRQHSRVAMVGSAGSGVDKVYFAANPATRLSSASPRRPKRPPGESGAQDEAALDIEGEIRLRVGAVFANPAQDGKFGGMR